MLKVDLIDLFHAKATHLQRINIMEDTVNFYEFFLKYKKLLRS